MTTSPDSNESHTPSSIPDSGIGDVLISSRGLDEYRAMFTLSDADLRRSILDCPGGASSTTAEIHDLGGTAVAVDPAYGRGLDADQLAALTRAETDRGNAYVRAHPDQYRWTFFTDPDHHYRSRSRAGQRFIRDYREHPERYLAGHLPHLPFATASFDLVLSSHLLFSYTDRLSPTFHHQAIAELVRLSSGEVRIFPLVAMGSVRCDVEGVIAALSADGISARITDVEYEFQAGGHQMLVCTRTR
jgi:SAM-dependent methyltransferase